MQRIQESTVKTEKTKHTVEFVRNGKALFKLSVSSRGEAEKLAAMWRSGATQGDIAQEVTR